MPPRRGRVAASAAGSTSRPGTWSRKAAARRGATGRPGARAGARPARAAAQSRSEIEADLVRRRVSRDALSEVLTLRQRELAGHEARLHSLEDLNNRRATFGDAARYPLAEPAASVRHHGAVADHLDDGRGRAYDRLDARSAICCSVLVDASGCRAGARAAHRRGCRALRVRGASDTRPAHRSPALSARRAMRTCACRAQRAARGVDASPIGDALVPARSRRPGSWPARSTCRSRRSRAKCSAARR